MANLVTSCIAQTKVPENFVFPPRKRPVLAGKVDAPIIDLHDEKDLAERIMKAIQDFGLFKVINHGVSRDLMDNAMKVFKELHDLPIEEKSKINTEEDLNQVCRIYPSSYNYDIEPTHFWRDVLRHPCHPLEEYIKYWPKKPEKYREIVGEYVGTLRNLGSKILEHISEGLGLEQEYFSSELSDDNILSVNHYPACPDPSLTLGLSKHVDPNLITILQSTQVPGVQLFKDGNWLEVDTPADAFVIFIGSQLEAVTNGKLKGAVHIVTNAREARTSAAFFINPSMDCIVEPAKSLLEAQNCFPIYRAFQYKEFFKAYTSQLGDRDAVLDAFKIPHNE